MAHSRVLPQNKEAMLKSYNKHLKDDMKSITDNYLEIIRLVRNSPEEDGQVSRLTHTTDDQYEMHVRAANIIRAAESLMKLIADIKQYLILNDFPSVNEAITKKTHLFQAMQADCDNKLMTLRDDIAAELYELEEEYYSSFYK